MFRVIIIAIFVFTLVSSTHLKKQGGNMESNYNENLGTDGLSYVLENSANQAVSNQHFGANQAYVDAKNSVAQIGASTQAQAALDGKLTILARLEQELQKAHQAVEAKSQQYQQAELGLASAQQVLQLAQHQLNVVNAAANAAQGTIMHATEAFNVANTKVGTQAAMLGNAKRRFSKIAQELDALRGEYQATQIAAQQASDAALLAQANAAQKEKSNFEQSAFEGNLQTVPKSFFNFVSHY